MKFRKVEGGVTAAKSFLAAGVAAGLKKNEKKDMALIYSQLPAAAAGMFTKNRFQAAPVLVSREHLADGRAQAIIVNSGNANACTGEAGIKDARRMAELTGELLQLQPQDVLVASTGVIGQYLPMVKVESGIRAAVEQLQADGGLQAAEAIMTTDTTVKSAAYQVEIGGQTVTVGGIAKGSGMIHPNMATMLAFITTDCAIAPPLLQQALKQTVDRSYNLITVDGDTSTNDMVVVLANGAAGNQLISEENDDYRRFLLALQRVNTELSQKIVRDGEGATKFLEVTVQHAATVEDARILARGILTSNLVKTAFFGEDANWGRIVMAMGQTEVEFYPERVDIFLGDLQVTQNGQGLPLAEERAKAILARQDIQITVDLHMGEAEATAWGADLSYDYVKINASYRS
ncbi:MAG TPA: ornithine acetyltransferase [Firmicutes bacterium]|mgnify:CR=1 FL=1|jgi:glutamate N-acetyltransferase/amino-acid N-acetyltransferase|nr:bifunctional glutamate N-acetyltransferase/amino-acid acetyltransferase ArgJ [Bacillota bacterium]HAA37299.1 ornithine acetyltransferase [Bacillota bacterium]